MYGKHDERDHPVPSAPPGGRTGIGIVVGVFAAAKIISILLKKFRQGTYCVIAGLMVGSVYAIYSYAFAEGESFAFNGR